MSANQRRYTRMPMKCRIRLCHERFGELYGHTRDLSDGGVYVRHPALADLAVGELLTGQVQDLPIEAPVLSLRVMRVDAEGAGLRFEQEDPQP